MFISALIIRIQSFRSQNSESEWINRINFKQTASVMSLKYFLKCCKKNLREERIRKELLEDWRKETHFDVVLSLKSGSESGELKILDNFNFQISNCVLYNQVAKNKSFYSTLKAKVGFYVQTFSESMIDPSTTLRCGHWPFAFSSWVTMVSPNSHLLKTKTRTPTSDTRLRLHVKSP